MTFHGLLALLLGARFGSTDAVFQRLLMQIDADGNGTIDAAEYARVDEVGPFSEVDIDGDDAVTVAELGQWVRVTQPRPDTHGARPAQALLSGSPPERGPVRRMTADFEQAPATESEPGRGRMLAIGAGVLALGLGVGVWSGRRSRRRR